MACVSLTAALGMEVPSKMAKQHQMHSGHVGKQCVGQTQHAWRECVRRWSEAVGKKWCHSTGRAHPPFHSHKKSSREQKPCQPGGMMSQGSGCSDGCFAVTNHLQGMWFKVSINWLGKSLAWKSENLTVVPLISLTSRCTCQELAYLLSCCKK